MSVLVAVGDSAEGRYALTAAADEAVRLGTDLIVVNLTLGSIDTSAVPDDLDFALIDRVGAGDRDPVAAVLDEIDAHPGVDRLVIGLKKRSRVGKALLGSVSQRLLLNSPVSVLAVKAP